MLRHFAALSLTLLVALPAARAQQKDLPPPAPPPSQPPPNPPPASAVAATVNGQSIPELAVFRVLHGGNVPMNKRDEVRPEILNFLIDNALVDQYLDQMKVAVEAKDIDAQMDKIKAQLKAEGKEIDQLYKALFLTEADLRTQINATLRWEKFIQQYGTEKALKEFFDGNKAMFDGSQMRAKHILLTVKADDAAANEQAKAKIGQLKKQIVDKVNQDLAADVGKLDNLELQKKKMKLLEDTFADVAAKESACPSKGNGGELGWFTRCGGRVAEPFAKAAFALKAWDLSEPVQTEFGWHLILIVDAKAGVERKFEEMKDVVRDVFADKMREAVVARMRPTAKIVLNPGPK
jgi:parvulin-like peptidyl-prolyl isomerase